MKLLKDDSIEFYIKTKLFIKRKNNNIRLNTNYKYFLTDSIIEYVNNCFDDSLSFKESLYRIYYNIDNHPTCQFCNNLSQFDINEVSLFRTYCNSKKCISKISKINSSQTKLKKYGDENYNNRKKCKLTKLEKYGDEKYNNSSQMKQTKIDKYGEYFVNVEKAKQAKLEKYGDENYNNVNKIQETCLIKYNAKCVLSKKSIIRNKIKQANIDKYGEYFVNVEKAKQTKLEKYGDENYNNVNKIQETCLKKYGYNTVFKCPEISQKIANSEIRKIHEYNTKKKNNTFNSSSTENKSYILLKEKYPDVINQYKDKRYPFVCDFDIPSLDLYIECNYHWTHGGHPFNENDENDKLIIEIWKDKNTNYYDNAITTWTIRDVNKRNIAKENKLNYIEFYSFSELNNWINLPLYINFNWSKIINEYNYYKHKEGNLNGATSYNFIIKYYQQDIFFKTENELIQNNEIKERLINNRCKYLNKNKDEITSYDLLKGFKYSGIYYGYSHFNPLIFKFFINKYKIKKCYDPTGGWGHRLLGSSDLDLYIYNDLSKTICNNVKHIAKDLKINNAIFYNNDANNFVPNYEFDAMFTCPPYYNFETYECDAFNTIEEYNQFIDNLFKVFYDKKSCNIFGLVIREDLLDDKHKNNAIEKFIINNKNSKHLNNSIKHKNNEILYIYKK